MIETTEKSGQVHVSVNGVNAQWFAMPDDKGYVIYGPQPVHHAVSLEEAIVLIAEWMGNWYTAAEAAERLVEMDVFSEAPSAHDICLWARNGLLPGAIKITGKGGAGRGGSWRIPGKALETLANKRR